MAECVITAGMGFGDEGKGSIIDFLARDGGTTLVVRYNGGAQAAHNVALADGRHHTFSQFGSGTFTPWSRTHLSRYMLVQPGSMLSENRHLESLGIHDAFDRTTIDSAALITTRFHAAVNRLREMSRAGSRHGSCGLGIGETVVDFLAHCGDVLFASDLHNPVTLRSKLAFLQGVNRMKVEALVADRPDCGADEWAWLSDPACVEAEAKTCEELATRVQVVPPWWLDEQIERDGRILFEGAQGVLLDQFAGFMPYCTRSTTTFANALTLLSGHKVPITRMGIIRSYMTRHGAGPMPTEDPDLKIPEMHNCLNPWQQDFRIGHFDMVLFRYALQALNGVDEIVITHMDVRPNPHKVCVGYDSPAASLMVPKDLPGQFRLAELLAKATPIYETRYGFDFVADLEEDSGKPVTYLSYGPVARDKTRRSKRAA